MTKMYECTICHGLNHALRTHCQYCGTIPAMYSTTGRPISYGDSQFREVAVAPGCERQGEYQRRRIGTHTVSLDYYGED